MPTPSPTDSQPHDAAVPDYDAELARYHEAFAPQLRAAIADLPLPAKAMVLDVPCGDGFYTKLLAERVGEEGKVVGSDALMEYLRRGYRAAARADVAEQTEFVKADAYHLPFDDQSFDVVWCAQSFISLDHPVAALQEFGRLIKRGGSLVVLESDDFHHVVLPWPVDLEIRLQEAYQAACREHYGNRNKPYVSRRMRQWLRAAGFDRVVRKTYVADRQQPLPEATRKYLSVYLRELVEFVEKHLPAQQREALARLTDPDSPQYLLNDENLELACLFTTWRTLPG
jgi:ubiquinone/menaquinone biosynthesis C-methylase UbiE